MEYKKAPLTLDQQIERLRERGLTVDDADKAHRWLTRVSYYRLKAYALPFKIPGNNRFIPGTNFQSICDLYNFDRKLRLLLLEAIERIEIGVRTSITYEISHEYGPFGHTDQHNFSPRFDHRRFMEDLDDIESSSRETFTHHFRRKYTSETHLPIWMASELLSFGSISLLYGALRPAIKKRIAGPFGLPDQIFGSWIHTLSVIRNICAHHSRLWNRELGVSPKLPPAPTSYWTYVVPAAARLYAPILITYELLMTIAPSSLWLNRIRDLIKTHPVTDVKVMGFPDDWETLPPWHKPVPSVSK